MRALSKPTVNIPQGGRRTASIVFASVIIIGLFLLFSSFRSLSSGTFVSLRGDPTTNSPFKTTRQSNRREMRTTDKTLSTDHVLDLSTIDVSESEINGSAAVTPPTIEKTIEIATVGLSGSTPATTPATTPSTTPATSPATTTATTTTTTLSTTPSTPTAIAEIDLVKMQQLQSEMEKTELAMKKLLDNVKIQQVKIEMKKKRLQQQHNTTSMSTPHVPPGVLKYRCQPQTQGPSSQVIENGLPHQRKRDCEIRCNLHPQCERFDYVPTSTFSDPKQSCRYYTKGGGTTRTSTDRAMCVLLGSEVKTPGLASKTPTTVTPEKPTTALKVLNNEEGNDWISERFQKGTPFVVGRLGGAESCLTVQYLAGATSIHACLDPHRASGIYPESPTVFKSFATIYMNALKQLDNNDAMATFPNIKANEDKIFPHLKCTTLVKNRAIEPFYFDDPWSKHLEGKTVLIVHGFISSIKCQLLHYKNLFVNEHVLPSFTPKFVQMPQALGGKTPHGSWMETLEAVTKLIDNVGPFDVAIVAAGAYAMPLAVHCKIKHNATAIAMGGGSQLMFGLKGKRWDTHPDLSKLYNKHWMYPLEKDTPDNAQTIEHGGPYWGPKEKRHAICPVKPTSPANSSTKLMICPDRFCPCKPPCIGCLLCSKSLKPLRATYNQTVVTN